MSNFLLRNRAIAAAALLGLSSLSFSSAAFAADKAGVSAAVRGTVELTGIEGDAERDLSEGETYAGGEGVFLGDTVESQNDSGMQLMLLDETTFTIGPDSDLTIDEFVYDPSTGAGELSAQATKGIFRFVSGSVTENNPDSTEIGIGSGTMGVRGTMSLVSLGEKEGILVINLGPGGDKEKSRDKRGVIEVKGSKNKTVLKESGKSAFLRPDGSVSEPFDIDVRRLAKLFNKLDQGTTTRRGPNSLGGRSLSGASKAVGPRNGPVQQSRREGHGDRSFVATDYSPDDFEDYVYASVEEMIDMDAYEYYDEYYEDEDEDEDEYEDEYEGGDCPC